MSKILVFLPITLVFVFISCNSNDSHSSDEKMMALEKRIELLEKNKAGLGQSMNRVLVHQSKLGLSIKHKNLSLIQYFLHELEEDFEYIVENHAQHDGVDIADLAENTVLPELHKMTESANNGDTNKLVQDFENLILSCNKCHVASDHSYIRIKDAGFEGYLNQDFTRP